MIRRIVIIGSFAESFIDFRGNLASYLIAQGFDVHVLLPVCDAAVSRSIRSLGVSLHHYPIDRAGKNPLSDLRTINAMRQLFYKVKPSHVLSYTVKPVMYSNLALLTTRLPARSFALITGLGYLFAPTGWKGRLAAALIKLPYRLSLKRCEKIIFQNPDDKQLFISTGMATHCNSMVVSGSGVDLAYYEQTPLPPITTFLMVSRLVKDKGINEYLDAAQRIRTQWPDIRFHLVGYLDENPSSLTQAQLQEGLARGGITFHGKTDDVRPYITQASVFVLPSYYREGVPRTILEAMAMGRAIITTDAPGCKETVIEGENGYLIEPRSVQALAAAIEKMLARPDKLAQMGQASRQLACSRFNDVIVNQAIVSVLV